MLFPEQALREFVGGQLEVFSHVAENPCKRAHTERIRLGNGDVWCCPSCAVVSRM